MTVLRKKQKQNTLAISPFSFFPPFNKQKVENQLELKSATSGTPNPWKASICPTTLNPDPGIVCLEKRSTLFLPAGWFQSCLHKPADPTAVGQCSCHLVKTTDLTNLHRLAMSYLCGQKEPNIAHKPITW
jgi:hypothetical protein